jgi:methionine synthase II (cobalamin-independent)
VLPTTTIGSFPQTSEITETLALAMSVIGPTRLWVNPDCGSTPTAG